MSKGHTAVNEFLEEKVRFADFFNGNLFQGQQIVLPEELEVIKGESDILIEDKKENVKEIRRYRDIVMRWKKEIYLVLLASEIQSKVHYAMPVRDMLYASLSYLEQTKELWQSHGKEEKVSEAEYLSRFRKDDKLVPVITVVFYYGTEKWDGSTDLYGMFSDESMVRKEILQKYVPNYWINLIDVDSIDNIECFQTDLKEIFGMMKLRNNKKALVDYLREHKDYFGSVDSTTYQVIGEFLQSEQILNQEVRVENNEGGKDMCKALDDLYQDGVQEGLHQGLHQGIIKTARKYHASDQDIIRQLIEELQISETEAEELLKNFNVA